jgi:site-specific DNA-methyltransferase (adenine-specific)
MDATLDLWELPTESATRVGHPAPFPVELPQRLIELYTYKGDVVLDPFMGSGSTAVAAVRTDRHFLGYDTEAAYVEAARSRIAIERASVVRPPVVDKVADAARALVEAAGFTLTPASRRKLVGGVLVASDPRGRQWSFVVVGASTVARPGLRRTDVLYRTIGQAAHLSGFGQRPVAVLASELPPRRSAGERALHEGRGHAFLDVLPVDEPASIERLAAYGTARTLTPIGEPLPPA